MAEDKDKQPARRPKTDDAAPAPGSAQEGAAMATETPTQAMERIEGMSAATRDMTRPAAPGQTANESDITNELGGGGVAFGDFTKSVGMAVAAAQAALDKTLVETAKALSETEINTVAVFEQKINDDTGEMEKGEVHIQKLPLTNYLMPTAYQWSRVFLEADMSVQEFNSRTGFQIQQSHFNADARVSGSYGFTGFGVKGSAGMNYGTNSTGTDLAYGQDTAAGRLHMEATLEPRGDVELPRPFVLQKGPRMQLQVGSKEEILGPKVGDAPAPVIGQKVKITAVLQKTDGSAMSANKPLSLNIADSSLNYTASGKTDAEGKMEIEIKRQGAAYDPAVPIQTMVRVAFGLVSASVGITL
jgi:hypothetical protein